MFDGFKLIVLYILINWHSSVRHPQAGTHESGGRDPYMDRGGPRGVYPLLPGNVTQYVRMLMHAIVYPCKSLSFRTVKLLWKGALIYMRCDNSVAIMAQAIGASAQISSLPPTTKFSFLFVCSRIGLLERPASAAGP